MIFNKSDIYDDNICQVLHTSNNYTIIKKQKKPHPFCWIGKHIKKGNYYIEFEFKINKPIISHKSGLKLHNPEKYFHFLENKETNKFHKYSKIINCINDDFIVIIIDEEEDIQLEINNITITELNYSFPENNIINGLIPSLYYLNRNNVFTSNLNKYNVVLDNCTFIKNENNFEIIKHKDKIEPFSWLVQYLKKGIYVLEIEFDNDYSDIQYDLINSHIKKKIKGKKFRDIIYVNDYEYFILVFDLCKKSNIKIKKFSLTKSFTLINNINDYNRLPPSTLYNYIKPNDTSTYISLTTIPPRLCTEIFLENIKYLSKQKLNCKIILNICYKYNRHFEFNEDVYNSNITYISDNFTNVIINYSEDYGPITKALGVLNCDFIKNDDIVIILDDDWNYNKDLVLYYNLAYQLYQSDGVAIAEEKILSWVDQKFHHNHEFFYDNYINPIYGWLSFSFKFKYIKKLKEFYDEIIKVNNKVKYHDDIILTIFYIKYNLNISGINSFLIDNFNFKVEDRPYIDQFHALSTTNFGFNRNTLSKELLSYYNINYNQNDDHMFYFDLSNYNYQINKYNIDYRNCLFNINNCIVNQEDNYNNHIDIKYYNNSHILVTITSFYNTNYNYFIINNKKYCINITNDYKRYTLLIKINNIEIKNNEHKDINIIQYNHTSNISYNKKLSILTILSMLPNYKYIFIDETNVHNYMDSEIINYYNMLIPCAYKSDLFRAYYLYHNGGIYFDCKNILLHDISEYLNMNNSIFVNDKIEKYISNGFIYLKNKKNIQLKNYLAHMIYNIKNHLYLNCCLSVTGPGLLGKYVDYNNSFKHTFAFKNNDWTNSIIISNSFKLIKTSFFNYYNENKYLDLHHYSVLWKNKNVFNQKIKIQPKYNYINGIDYICWINLDRSKDRYENMTRLLNNVSIPNERIVAIDGNNDLSIYRKNKNSVRSNYEDACLFSHIKTLDYLNKLEGKYFLVLEDDINFNNTCYFNVDLKHIIENAPDFDFLLIHNINHLNNYDKLYIDWNDYPIPIASTAGYIVNKNSISKIIDFFKDTNTICQADEFLYRNCTTYVYSYNFVNTILDDSTIGNDLNHPKVMNIKNEIEIIKYFLL